MSYLTNKLFSILGFAPPVDLLRFNGDNLLPESVMMLSLSSSCSPIITQSVDRLGLNVIDSSSVINEKSVAALIIDATQYQEEGAYAQLYQAVSKAVPYLSKNARVVIVGNTITTEMSPQESAFSQGLVGFSKSLAKEIGRKGTTLNVVFIAPNITDELVGPLQFLLSAKSTFISGQVISVRECNDKCDDNSESQKHDKVSKRLALVTGASQGIGAAIADTLARDNYHVVGVDIEPAKDKLHQKMTVIGGDSICLDISSDNAGQVIADYLAKNNHQGFDVIVHNAGITRDKTLAKMPEQWWTSTLDINLLSVMKINDYLLKNNAINDNGQIVCMASMNGIAGQVGQTNYSMSKAGLIGYVDSFAQTLASRNITINAVAPGFIETKMTEQIPFFTREMGRRMNALSQGGKAQDVAEAVAFFAQPQSYAVTGQTLRVCGLNFIGA